MLLSLIIQVQSTAQTTYVWDCSSASTPTSGTNANLTVGTWAQGNNNGTTTLISSTSASSSYTGASGTSNFGAAARVGALSIGASGSAYFEITLTPAANYIVTLTGLSFGTRCTSTGPVAYTLRKSTDAYASDVATGAITANSTWQLKSNTGLSSASSAGTAITYRIYGYSGAGTASAGTANWRVDDINLTVTVTSTITSPTIFGTSTATAFTTTYGTASAAQSFAISGSALTADLTATAPTGFEVSSDGTTYSNTATFAQTSGSASGTLRVRLKADAAVTGSYNAQNIVLSSTGATSINITTASSGNTVTAKALTLTGLSANNKNYDGTTTATLSGSAAYSGLVNGESFSVTGTPSASFANSAAGSGKTVTVTGYTAPSANYSLTQPSFTADINTVELTISGITGANKEYDATAAATFTGTAAYSGLVNGETYSVSGTPSASFTDANIGTAKTITITGYTAPSANYTIAQPVLSADITAKSLTISGLAADNKQFDGTTDATLSGTATLNGVLTADNGNVVLGGTPVATFASASVGSNIAVTVTGYTITGSASGNYSLTQPTGLTANITSGSLQNQTITFNTLSNVTYGDADFALTGSASSGLTVSYVSSNTSVATVSGNTVTIVGAGSANITASQAGDGSYNPAVSVTRTLTVDPKALTVTGATAQNKIYDGTTDAVITGGSLNGVIGSDVVSITGGGNFAAATVGTTIDVTAALSLAGAAAGNYIITQPTGLSADIEAREVTITGLNADNKIYDGNTFVSLSGIISLTGITSSDLSDVYLIEDFASAAFVSSSVGNNIHVDIFDLFLDGPASSNYYLTLPTNLSANILPLTLNVSGLTAENKTYDGTTTATITGTPSLSGMISGEETLVELTGTPSASFANAAVGNNKTVSVSGYSLTGTGAANYTISSPLTLTANISGASLTVTGITANNKVYDGTTTATITGTPILSGVLSGDIGNVTLNGTGTAAFADANAGTGKVVNVTGYSISGTAAANYTLTQPTVLSADITQATQTISFFPIPVKTTSDVTVTLTLNSSATLPITYTSSNTSVATVSGNILTIVGAGTSVITASQPGNTNYSAALDVTQTLTVVPALSKWTFEGVTTSNTGTIPNISVGSGVADQGILTSGTLFSAAHASSGTVWTNPAGNGSLKSVTSTNWATGDYYQFKANTTGYKNILVYVDQTGSNTGPRDFKLQFSLNGTTYTDFGTTYALTNDSWSSTINKSASSRSFDISSITGLNNNSAVYFRVVCAATNAISGTFASGGTNRLDNFLVSGIPCEPTSSSTDATACDSYSWNGSTYTTSGVYTYASRNSIGCDSFAILNLTINNSTHDVTTAANCNSYDWNGTTYTTSGTYTYYYTNASGCASTDTLHLTINTGTFNSNTQSACDSYDWNGTTYTNSGTYTYSYNNANGCASVDTLHLTITTSTTQETTQSACDSYVWSVNGTTYTSTGTYTAVVGCVTNILNLTITSSTSNTSSASACDSYTWSVNGQTYTSSGSYSFVSGCHTDILNLTITPSTTNTTNASACDSYTWSVNGQSYTSAGTYSVVSGCHTEILNLTFTSSTTSTATITACDSYTWAQDGNTYTNSGSYTSVSGCATYILDLTIVASSTNSTSATACDSYTWSVNGQTYTSSGSYTSVAGCVSSILNLTIRYSTSSTETISTCDSYTWHGTTYTSSNNTATWTGTNAAGCDSIVTLNLTIRYSTSSTETISACDSYTWHGTTYTVSNNTATWTGTNAAGCDSVVTLNLTITPSSSNTATQSACDSYTWNVNGQTYTTSGSYTSVSGCATQFLNLTITASTSNTTTTTVCGSYTWNVNGQTYTSSGTYTNVSGCATQYLALTVIPVVNNVTTAAACNSYTWNVNGQTYTQSGTYTVAVTDTTPSGGAGGGVRISQVYPGGGGSTGTYLKDYVELYNSSCSPINISGWSIAYGSSTGNFVSTAANGFTFPTGTTIGAKKYLLIECGAAGTAGAALPVAADFTTLTTGFSMSATNGKVALFNTSITNLACSSLVANTVIDKVSWGTGNCPEGTAKTSPTATQVMVRANAGETDTDNNSNDFVNTATSSAAPRNSSSSANSASPCVAACTNEILNLTITPSTSNTTTASACDSYTWSVNGQTYTTSGSYTSVSGCATEILNLTITASSSNTTPASACDSYTWSVNGQTYTTSGSYTSVSGCATQILNLTVTTSSSNTTTASACDSYTWSVNSQTYTTSGTYSSVSGCHTELLVLTINSNLANPIASITQPTCATATGTITVTTPVGDGITYSIGGSYQSSPVFSGLTAGTYTISVQSGAGCTSASNGSATVNAQPQVPGAVSVSGLTNVCAIIGTSTTTTYTASAAGATGYTWTVPANTVLVSGQGTATITVRFLSGFASQPNKQIRVTATSSCGSSAQKIYYLSALLPGTPAAIVASTANVCPSIGTGVAITYRIPKVMGAASYIWTAQNGTTNITNVNGAGENDTLIAVTFENNFSSSNITVQVVNDCGVSGIRSLTVYRNNPSTPGLISGPANACAYIGETGVNATYSIAPNATVVSYTWTIPAGATNVSGQGTNSISFRYPQGFSGGSISVTATNGCGTSGSRSLTISVLPPSYPSQIDVINLSACPNRSYSYSVSSMPSNATSLHWEVPVGGTIVSGQGTTSIVVNYGSGLINGNVSVIAVSNCGASLARNSNVKLTACAPGFAGNTNNKSISITGGEEMLQTAVFPNPSASSFNLQLKGNSQEAVSIRVLDAQGRVVKSFRETAIGTINFGNELKAGVYMVEVKQGNALKTTRLVKY